MRVGAAEIAFVPKSIGATELRDVKLREWSEQTVGGTIDCTMDRAAPSQATFECSAGSKNERARPPKDVCKVAEACGARVFSQLGSKFDADQELGNPRSRSMCQKALAGLKDMAAMNGAPPPECR